MSGGVYRGRRNELRAREARAASEPLLLDGATGTELERRGLPTALPLWSAPALLEHPHAVREIHGAYVRAGAEVVTANTFRTQRHTLAAGGLADRAAELTGRAVALAREAAEAGSSPAFVVGSAPPLEDCYHPERVPDESVLRSEHDEHLANLEAAGVDGVLVETMNTAREAALATRLAVARGLPTWTSFVCWEGAALLDGSLLEDAARSALDAGASAVLVNCLPPSNVAPCLEVLARTGGRFGVYANLGEPDEEQGIFRSEDCTPEAFAEQARSWVAAGARLVGGCCGTTPDHLAAVRGGALDR